MSEIRTDRAIRVHALDEARAAAAAAAALGMPLLIVSGRGAGRYAGAGWFRALVERLRAEFPGLSVTAVLDCADSPGAALAALREGVGDVALDGPPDVVGRVAGIAAALGARIHPPVESAFEIASEIASGGASGTASGPEGRSDAVRACREWLLGSTEVRPPDIANRDITGY
ncbi:hypothetical protein [Arenibaculum sp.]|jgi:hypothetical protein|uniref:hypothetical protein n=1 Tax=Arenibaculum sp. TaxID=2865862 RepID=UPI002E103A93|nr:hypothetical protein [Arenibaculum sp.]